MKHHLTIFSLILVTLPGYAQDGSPSFLFSSPEVSKLDWNARSIRAGDIDGDGRQDLVVINNDAAKVEVLLQREPGSISEQELRSIRRNRWEPVLEDSRFLKKSIVIAQYGYALELGDFNADGRTDIAFTGNNDPLTVLLQGDENDWSERWTFDDMQILQWISTLAVADINGDGLDDLAALSDSEIYVFIQEPDTDNLPEPSRYRLAADNPYGLLLEDLNGDGLRDIRYLANDAQRPFRLRLQLPEGGFGPEQSFELDITSASIRPMPAAGNTPAKFAYIHDKSRQIELASLRLATTQKPAFSDLQPLIYSSVLKGEGSETSALADFDGDGLLDIVIGDSVGAQIMLFLQQPEGNFAEAVSFPSFSGISGLDAGDADGDGRAELFVVSKDEGLAGVTRLDESGRFPFPDLFSLGDAKPFTVAAADFDADGKAKPALLLQDSKDIAICLFSPDGDGNWLETARIEVGPLKRDPAALQAILLNQDNLPDLVLYQQRDPAMLFVQNPDAANGWQAVAEDSPLLESQLNKITPANIASLDIDADGQREIVVAREGFARAIRLDNAGQLQLLDQYNARNSHDPLAGPATYDFDGDGVRELFLLSVGNNTLQMLKTDEQGVYRYEEELKLASLNHRHTAFVELGTNKQPHFLFFGAEHILALPLAQSGWQMDSHIIYETDLKNVTYTSLEIADFNNDGKADILVLDAQNHIIELLYLNEDEDWQSGMHFTVFDVNLHYQGRSGAPQEPREIIAADLTDDGKTDFVALVHDRLLLYVQE